MSKNSKINSEIESKIDNIKRYLDSKDLDYYDIRIYDSNATNIIIDNVEIKNINEQNTLGVGIRIYKNKKLGFCSSNNLDNYKKIIDDTIASVKKSTEKTELKNFAENKDKVFFKYKEFENKSTEKKTKELLKINKNFLNQKDKDISILKSDLIYNEFVRKSYFVNPYSYIFQERPYVVMYSKLTAKRNQEIETNLNRVGNIGGLELFDNTEKMKMITENKETIKELLYSKACPNITTDSIITPDISDLLSHEAIGHACEGDIAITNKSSVLKKDLVLTKKDITVVDDPTKKLFGYFKYDDEGIKARKVEIVKNGKVNEFMTDIKSSTIIGEKSNGSARADSYSSDPIVRMSNTSFKAGDHKYSEMIHNFSGFVLKGFSGGQVDPNVGTFMFGIKQAYKYEKGKIIEKYKQASISGNILTYLNNIKEISKTTDDSGFGFCGKDGQTAFVGTDSPYMKLNKILVGGTKHE